MLFLGVCDIPLRYGCCYFEYFFAGSDSHIHLTLCSIGQLNVALARAPQVIAAHFTLAGLKASVRQCHY